jgi:glycosyltransferase involved in cell wall biosynthesis
MPEARPENGSPEPPKLRVALVTELYEPSVGGQQTRFRALAHGLRDLGVSVSVITTMHERGLAHDEVLDGVRVMRGPLMPGYMHPRFAATVRSPIGMVRYGWRCRRLLRSQEFDAAYFNQWPYLHILLAGRRIRSRAGIDWCEARDSAIHSLPLRLLPRLVSFNLAVNQWTAGVIEERSHVPVGYLPSGVLVDRFRSPATERAGLLFLGRLVPNKNLPLLLSGFAKYRSRGGRERLVIAGTGPDEGALRASLANLEPSVAAAVEVLGEVSDEQKRQLLSTSRLLVIPSLREGFPNVVVEALASGTPTVTVSSPENGTAHVVRLYGIGVVEAPDSAGVADGIARALEEWPTLHDACTSAAPQFDWSVLSLQLRERLLSSAKERAQ